LKLAWLHSPGLWHTRLAPQLWQTRHLSRSKSTARIGGSRAVPFAPVFLTFGKVNAACVMFTVEYFGLQGWVHSVTGLAALGGLIFGCGLPGWAIVRWVFNFIEKNRDAGIDEIAQDVKEIL
jgi:hypothetical protein